MDYEQMRENERYEFFRRNRAVINEAYAERDYQPILELMHTVEFRLLFPDMTFHEAHRRYVVAPTCPSCGGEIHVAELRNDRMTSIRRYCERCGYSTAETWPVKLPPQDAD